MQFKSIFIDSVSYFYSNGTEIILDDITFSLNNEVVSILAPTGAGKTTLLNVISGILTPVKGKILINNLTPKKASESKKIGISFQDSTLLEWKSVMQNILLPLTIGQKSALTPEDRERANELIKLVGLEEVKDRKCSELSGGMKQRVGLARALSTNPDLILFDEPFNKLDFITKTNLLVEFRKILKKRNVNSIMVTHDIEDAVFFSDKVIVFTGSPLKLKKEVKIDLLNRDKTVFEDETFLKKVGEIKQIILK